MKRREKRETTERASERDQMDFMTAEGTVVRVALSNQHHKRAGAWTREEHELFFDALERYPCRPWRSIASHIGSKNDRQTRTHARACAEKFKRRHKQDNVCSSPPRSSPPHSPPATTARLPCTPPTHYQIHQSTHNYCRLTSKSPSTWMRNARYCHSCCQSV